jgi:hypothetical protein
MSATWNDLKVEILIGQKLAGYFDIKESACNVESLNFFYNDMADNILPAQITPDGTSRYSNDWTVMVVTKDSNDPFTIDRESFETELSVQNETFGDYILSILPNI